MAKLDEVTRRRREKEDAKVVDALREAGISVESVLADLLAFVTDRRLGKGRQTLAESLGSFRPDPTAISVLVQLLRDDEVAGHAIIALRKLKAQEAWPAIEPLLEHPQAWVRREARKAQTTLK